MMAACVVGAPHGVVARRGGRGAVALAEVARVRH